MCFVCKADHFVNFAIGEHAEATTLRNAVYTDMADFGLVETVNNQPDEPRLQEARSWRNGAAMIMDEWLCIRCGLCAQICPTNCITMQHYEPKLVRGELLVP